MVKQGVAIDTHKKIEAVLLFPFEIYKFSSRLYVRNSPMSCECELLLTLLQELMFLSVLFTDLAVHSAFTSSTSYS